MAPRRDGRSSPTSRGTHGREIYGQRPGGRERTATFAPLGRATGGITAATGRPAAGRSCERLRSTAPGSWAGRRRARRRAAPAAAERHARQPPHALSAARSASSTPGTWPGWRTGSHDIAVGIASCPPPARSRHRGTGRDPGPLYAFRFGLLASGIAGVASDRRRALDEWCAGGRQARPAAAASWRSGRSSTPRSPGRRRRSAPRALHSRRPWAPLGNARRPAGAIEVRERARPAARGHPRPRLGARVDLHVRRGWWHGVYAASPLQRCFRDIHVATSYDGVRPRRSSWRRILSPRGRQRDAMMELFEALSTTRRGVRRFTDAPISAAEFMTCLRAATQAPAAATSAWQFLVVTEWRRAARSARSTPRLRSLRASAARRTAAGAHARGGASFARIRAASTHLARAPGRGAGARAGPHAEHLHDAGGRRGPLGSGHALASVSRGANLMLRRRGIGIGTTLTPSTASPGRGAEDLRDPPALRGRPPGAMGRPVRPFLVGAGPGRAGDAGPLRGEAGLKRHAPPARGVGERPRTAAARWSKSSARGGRRWRRAPRGASGARPLDTEARPTGWGPPR